MRGHNTIIPEVFKMRGYYGAGDNPKKYLFIRDVEILNELKSYYKNVYSDIERAVYYPEVAEKILGYKSLYNKTFVHALEVSDCLDILLYRVISTLKHLACDSQNMELFRFDYAHNIIFNIDVFKKVYTEYRASEMYF